MQGEWIDEIWIYLVTQFSVSVNNVAELGNESEKTLNGNKPKILSLEAGAGLKSAQIWLYYSKGGSDVTPTQIPDPSSRACFPSLSHEAVSPARYKCI